MERQEEKELVRKLLSGDQQALRTVYKDYYKNLYRFVYSRIPQKHIAEELTQDIFINFLESVRDFRHQSSIKTFIYTIARNKVIDHIRKKKVKKVFFSHLPSFIVEGLSPVIMEDEIERQELQKKLEKTFEALPHDYSLILRLKYIEDKSVKEIAKKLVRSFKSTESLLFRARQAFIEVYKSLP